MNMISSPISTTSLQHLYLAPSQFQNNSRTIQAIAYQEHVPNHVVNQQLNNIIVKTVQRNDSPAVNLISTVPVTEAMIQQANNIQIINPQ